MITGIETVLGLSAEIVGILCWMGVFLVVIIVGLRSRRKS